VSRVASSGEFGMLVTPTSIYAQPKHKTPRTVASGRMQKKNSL